MQTRRFLRSALFPQGQRIRQTYLGQTVVLGAEPSFGLTARHGSGNVVFLVGPLSLAKRKACARAIVTNRIENVQSTFVGEWIVEKAVGTFVGTVIPSIESIILREPMSDPQTLDARDPQSFIDTRTVHAESPTFDMLDDILVQGGHVTGLGRRARVHAGCLWT